MCNLFVTALVPLVAAGIVSGAHLKPGTDRVYLDQLKTLESRMAARKHFLLIDEADGLREKVRTGLVHIAGHRAEKEPPEGLIHHWEGAAFVPRATLREVLALMQNYDQHKTIYAPEVIDSKTLRHQGNDFHVRLRLLKKKVITAVIETEHDIHYKPVSDTRWESAAHTTKVAEVDYAGTDREVEQPAGQGHGFVWRLDSYWRFLEADGGVYLECTSLTLSRDVPLGLGKLVRPIIDELPEESIRGIMTKTRAALKK